ncbi:hypothetical protein B0H11DRAFT_777031 [Mycena galericulata]|nr:hypothetical protein B0H11DRAFT_777031 [Mycena galericulata]
MMEGMGREERRTRRGDAHNHHMKRTTQDSSSAGRLSGKSENRRLAIKTLLELSISSTGKIQARDPRVRVCTRVLAHPLQPRPAQRQVHRQFSDRPAPGIQTPSTPPSNAMDAARERDVVGG